MSGLREALDLLRSEPDIIRHSPFARSIGGSKECAPLIEVRDALRVEIGNVKSSAPPLDPKRVWHRFEASRGDLNNLNGLEIRTLCTAEEFATKPVFVEALHAQPEHLKNGRCLYAMVNSYFVRWREMEKPDTLEALLTNAINRYPRKSPVIERWGGAHSLFSARAAEALAEFVVSRNQNSMPF